MRSFNPQATSEARRALLRTALCLTTTFRSIPSSAALSGGADSIASQYSTGSRAEGGRGANALLKRRAESGVQRIGTEPLFKRGSILDTVRIHPPVSPRAPLSSCSCVAFVLLFLCGQVRSENGIAVDISFNFPEAWTLSSGPNLDVRDVRTSDSAFLLVAPAPKSAQGSVEGLPRAFYTDLIFAPDGKYGAYGGVDDFSVKNYEVVSVTAPSGVVQVYRQFDLTFNALTYNQNLVQRRAKVSAISLGGSVLVLVAGCLGTRFKDASKDLAETQKSFRAYSTSASRNAELEKAAVRAEEAVLAAEEADDRARADAIDAAVGATTIGKIGFSKKQLQ